MSSKELPVIRRLRIRFIALAMISLFVLLSLIVAGMNIINYNKVVSSADANLDVLEQNIGMMQNKQDRFGGFGNFDEFFESLEDEKFLFGRGGKGGPRMSMDEAEESRFFSVTIAEDGTCEQIYVDRISAVNQVEAEEYAEMAIGSGRKSGFIGDFRYAVDSDGSDVVVTFLDCGRTLAAFRSFLRASVLMSLLGLLIVYVIITYFAGRIIKPVSESYEKQKRFITDAGHEIKTPLAIIKANLDVIKLDPESTEESLNEIDGQVDRLAGLTEDLVYLSRMEEGGSELVMTEVPLSDIVTETVSSFDALTRERDIVIETDIDPLVSIEGSNKELEKLISILTENAVKYSSGAEPIKISLKKDGRNAIIKVVNKVEDALDSEKLTHVFERFYRIDDSRNSAAGGHGIGLSMAAAIVQAHKGRIAASTSDGDDFIITVTFTV